MHNVQQDVHLLPSRDAADETERLPAAVGERQRGREGE